MATYAVRREHPQHRALRVLGADLVFRTPGLSALARRFGATLACMPDAQRLLNAGELVGVFPEGFKGIGKPFSQRYRLQRFGRGGFVQAAITTGVPIIPVSIVGLGGVLSDAGPTSRCLARGVEPALLPGDADLPAGWGRPGWCRCRPSGTSSSGTPVAHRPSGRRRGRGPAIVFELADRVRESIQESLFRLLSSRRSIWR